MASTLEPQKVLDLFPRALDTGSQYGTITIRKGGVASEVTTLRADGDYLDGRRPEVVQFGKSLKEDLLRRDFTINAMAVHVGRRALFDPWGGQADIQAGRLRAVGNAGERLREDGLRAMRAFRSCPPSPAPHSPLLHNFNLRSGVPAPGPLLTSLRSGGERRLARQRG